MVVLVLVLIETYWNVNMGKHYGYGLSQWVLIETYWNVKLKKDKLLCVRKAVLIETYWNVKVLSAGGSGAL